VTARSERPQRAQLRVLVAGGGVAGVEAMLALRDLAGELVEVELLSTEPRFWYRPVSVAEPFGEARTHGFDLAALAHDAGAAFTLGSLVAVDADARRARTSSGQQIEYDALVVTTGVRPHEAVPGALTFRGPADTDAFASLLEELESGEVRRVAFALPTRTVWGLPLYELALQTAVHAERRGLDVELTVVTHEQQPLEILGDEASEALRELLDERGIVFAGARHPVSFEQGRLRVVPAAAVEADRVVALPALRGERIRGLPQDRDGFLPTDRAGRVRGVDGAVYAAGDVTQFPVKHGGLATRQADVVAADIARRAGAAVPERPRRLVVHALLATGARPLYIEADVTSGRSHATIVSREPLWWPPAKIAGRHLAPFLATRLLGGVPA
jgi:sulfide:quinone oxidoreductase